MKVFFAVDGSHGSTAAVRQVGELLSPQNDTVAFYFAPPEIIVRHAAAAEETRERARKAIADAVFDEGRTSLPPLLAATSTEILAEHTAAEGILIEARKWNAELIVLGAQGMSAWEQLLLGSVSQAVAHNSTLPVCIVRPRPADRQAEPLRVLFAYDGSTGSAAALATAERLTFPTGTQVFALAVVESIACGSVPAWLMQKARHADATAMADAWGREHEDDKRQAHDQLAEHMAKQPAPFSSAESIVAEGHAAEQILRVVHERRIDLVVLGSHGKGMIERLLIGSTSSKVLAGSPCSVLLARGK
ncbi:MAG: universal stress protein [Planctomycetia bacterium]|nr:universal stress protein [Planctomycetia bacterium]